MNTTAPQRPAAEPVGGDDATQRWRRLRRVAPRPLLIAGATAGVALPLIVALVAVAGRRWFPVLDLAMTEFRLRDVGGSQTPLIGLPGRIGELPDQGSHPGPLSFWLLAPGYRLFGASAWAMEAATVVLQLAWIAMALWIGHRRLGTAGVATVAAILAVLIRGYGLTTLIQPWNPYLPLLAWIVVLLATWSVFCGDHLMLVPLAVAASFCAQTHIPYLLMAGGLGLAATAVVGVRWRRSAANVDGARRTLVVTVGVVAVLWAAPIVDQFRHDPGNVRRLLDHFGSPPEEAIGAGAGFRLLLRHLDVVGGFGELVLGDQRFLFSGFEPDGPLWPGALVLVAWIASVVVARRVGHRPLLLLHAVVGLTLLLSFVSMSRIFGERWFYLTLWAWGTTAVLLVSIAWTALRWWNGHVTVADTGRRLGAVVVTGLACVVAAVATISMVVVAPSTDHPEEALGETVGELLGPTVQALTDGTYVLVWDDAFYFGSQAFGLQNELRRAGLDVNTYDYWRVPSTPSRVVTPESPIDAEIIFATGGFVDRWRVDERVTELVAVEPRTPDEIAEYQSLRTELIAELRADGRDDLVDQVDVNLFGVRIDPRISARARQLGTIMIDLGLETAVFLAPPGTSLADAAT